jgi:hypothetical protein
MNYKNMVVYNNHQRQLKWVCVMGMRCFSHLLCHVVHPKDCNEYVCIQKYHVIILGGSSQYQLTIYTNNHKYILMFWWLKHIKTALNCLQLWPWLLVITGYFHGIIHSIFMALYVLVTGIWAITATKSINQEVQIAASHRATHAAHSLPQRRQQ